MQMNNQAQARRTPSVRLTLIWCTAVMWASIAAGVDQDSTEENRPATKADQPQQESRVSETENTGQKNAGQKSADGTGIQARPVKPFKPSETIGADSAVSFPIDI